MQVKNTTNKQSFGIGNIFVHNNIKRGFGEAVYNTIDKVTHSDNVSQIGSKKIEAFVSRYFKDYNYTSRRFEDYYNSDIATNYIIITLSEKIIKVKKFLGMKFSEKEINFKTGILTTPPKTEDEFISSLKNALKEHNEQKAKIQ